MTSYTFEDGKEAYISFSRAGSSKCTLLCYASQDLQQVDQKAYSTVPKHPLPCSEEKDRVKISEPCGNTQNPCVLMSDIDSQKTFLEGITDKTKKKKALPPKKYDKKKSPD